MVHDSVDAGWVDKIGMPSSPQFPDQSANLARSSSAWRTGLVIKGMLQILVLWEETLVLCMKPPQGSKQVIWPKLQSIQGGQRC